MSISPGKKLVKARALVDALLAIEGSMPLFELRAVGSPDLRAAIDDWREAEKAGTFALDALVHRWPTATRDEDRRVLMNAMMDSADRRGAAHGRLPRLCESHIYDQEPDEAIPVAEARLFSGSGP